MRAHQKPWHASAGADRLPGAETSRKLAHRMSHREHAVQVSGHFDEPDTFADVLYPDRLYDGCHRSGGDGENS
uniref:Uncharacterized protein n=1 Tax=Anopheles maculatus TaxID=74869 RepID=A0A182SCR5_9DIPT